MRMSSSILYAVYIVCEHTLNFLIKIFTWWSPVWNNSVNIFNYSLKKNQIYSFFLNIFFILPVNTAHRKCWRQPKQFIGFLKGLLTKFEYKKVQVLYGINDEKDVTDFLLFRKEMTTKSSSLYLIHKYASLFYKNRKMISFWSDRKSTITQSFLPR